MRQFYVYILASTSRVLYVGVTNDLVRRVYQHKRGVLPGFSRRYHVTTLVYFEQTADIASAIAREKHLKRLPRARKARLIETHNAGWMDLSASWSPKE